MPAARTVRERGEDSRWAPGKGAWEAEAGTEAEKHPPCGKRHLEGDNVEPRLRLQVSEEENDFMGTAMENNATVHGPGHETSSEA